jgi:hypothetical protein
VKGREVKGREVRRAPHFVLLFHVDCRGGEGDGGGGQQQHIYQ